MTSPKPTTPDGSTTSGGAPPAWRCARHAGLAALRASLDGARPITAEEAALVASSLAAFEAGHADVIAAVAAARDAVAGSPEANLALVMQLDGWLAAMRAGSPPPAHDPQLAALLRDLGPAGLRPPADLAVRAGAEALDSLVESVRLAAAIVALPAFAPHLAATEARFARLPTYARVACAEALTAHRNHPDAVGILTRARDALLARAGDNAAKRARVAPFVAQFDGWIAAARG